MLEGDRQAGRRHFEVEAEEGIAEIIAVLQHQSAPASAFRGAGAGDPGELDLLQRDPGGAPGGHANRVEIAIEHEIELAPSGRGGSAAVVDDQVVDPSRIMGIGKIGLPEHHHIIRSIAIYE